VLSQCRWRLQQLIFHSPAEVKVPCPLLPCPIRHISYLVHQLPGLCPLLYRRREIALASETGSRAFGSLLAGTFFEIRTRCPIDWSCRQSCQARTGVSVDLRDLPGWKSDCSTYGRNEWKEGLLRHVEISPVFLHRKCWFVRHSGLNLMTDMIYNKDF